MKSITLIISTCIAFSLLAGCIVVPPPNGTRVYVAPANYYAYPYGPYYNYYPYYYPNVNFYYYHGHYYRYSRPYYYHRGGYYGNYHGGNHYHN